MRSLSVLRLQSQRQSALRCVYNMNILVYNVYTVDSEERDWN